MAPIGQELRDRDFCDEDWNRANGRRFIRCVGVQDHSKGSDRQYEEDAPLEEMPQADLHDHCHRTQMVCP